MNFRQLHEQGRPLLIANVWDVASAKIAEKLGFQAIGTSSAAIATSLGYEDGERLHFDALYSIVERIKACTHVPLSVDLESGYGTDIGEIIDNIGRLVKLKIVGINIEDSVCLPDRKLLTTACFSHRLRQIKSTYKSLFVNARIDAFLLNIPNALEETVIRMRAYQKVGIDGVFVPGAVDISTIYALCKATYLPVNVMCMPDLADFDQLAKAGVRRISMGNGIYEATYRHFEDILQGVTHQKSFNSIFAK